MSLRDWIVTKLGGDEPVGDPAAIVEVAVVELWRSELVVQALRDAGIPAHAVAESTTQYTAERLLPQARIFVPNARRTEAIDVIDATTSQAYGPTDD